MTPAEIVEQHRKDLIRRLLTKNPLLHFRPPKEQDNKTETGVKPRKRIGTKIDICNFFDKQDSGVNSDPEKFLRDIIESSKDNPVTVDLSSDSAKRYLAPLDRLQSNAMDAYRATGRWELSLAWPLLHIPRDGAKNPYCAPLLFWKIKVSIQGENTVVFSRRGDGVEFNFMLKECLEKEKNIKLVWDNDDRTVGLDAFANRIKDTFQKIEWDQCQDFDSFGKNGFVNEYQYNPEAGVALTPCAMIGKAGFAYRPLLEELNVLYERLKNEDPEGLLHELLVGSDSVSESSPSEEPNPADRWLVTDDSDATQEASVWQARQEKIMFIKGPPGTGKSQTIVNLIADAVQRGERVVLACQKKPALDVVRKRLESGEHNLGGIAIQVNDPRRNRYAIIKGIIEIGNNEPAGTPVTAVDTRDRDTLCERIAQSEKECVLPDDNISHSVHGDLCGIISRIKNETDFDPSSYQLESFISEIRQSIGDPIDQRKSDQWKEESGKLADNWESCNYKDNPWRSIPVDWDRNKRRRLSGECKNLQELFSHIADRRKSLPAFDLLTFAESPLMTKYFHVFFDGEQRQVVSLLCRLISDTRQLFLNTAEIEEIVPLWNALFNDNASDNPYKRYRLSCDNIPTILEIRRQLADHLTLRIMIEKYPDKCKNWRDILLAVISELRLTEIQSVYSYDSYDYERAIERLKYDISKKERWIKIRF